MLVLMLKRMDNSGKRNLPDGNCFHHHEGDLPLVEEVNHHQGGDPHLLEGVLHPLPCGRIGLLHGHPHEGCEVVQYASALQFHQEGVHLPDELAALQGDHHLYSAVAAHQFVGLLVHVQDQFLLAGVKDRLKDVEGPVHPTLNHQVLARVSGRYPEVVLQEGPGEEEAAAIAAAAVPLLLDPSSACV
ncbi:hypothetical protein MRB53_024033 [Persea americana]|uniref:Uncharacterized protein n=1 Tax=Persea americana TaxID=3435 RepID=A0ACC2LBS1_PERAE|nr:hypothetical protein MRB53_024033 [Persea americana]